MDDSAGIVGNVKRLARQQRERIMQALSLQGEIEQQLIYASDPRERGRLQTELDETQQQILRLYDCHSQDLSRYINACQEEQRLLQELWPHLPAEIIMNDPFDLEPVHSLIEDFWSQNHKSKLIVIIKTNSQGDHT